MKYIIIVPEAKAVTTLPTVRRTYVYVCVCVIQYREARRHNNIRYYLRRLRIATECFPLFFQLLLNITSILSNFCYFSKIF